MPLEREISMEIALTKRLADQVKIKLDSKQEEMDPLFSWTANWTNVYDGSTNDLLVLVNNATRFVATVYPFGQADFANFGDISINAIRKSLQSFNFSPAMIDKYMDLAGEAKFTQNHNRSAASWVSKAGLDCALHIGAGLEQGDHPSTETLIRGVNHGPIRLRGNKEYSVPYEELAKALSKLTHQQLYAYGAFELLITLDLEIYQVKRDLIVPASIDFFALHRVIQSVFNWDSYHLYDFSIYGDYTLQPIHRLVPFEEDLEFDATATLLKDQRLQEYLPKHKEILYTYDYGDNWEHRIQLVKVYEEYDGQSPFLLRAEGKAPPEDVGGAPGFIRFLEAYHDPNHPEHEELKEWAGLWSPELWDWEKKPRIIW